MTRTRRLAWSLVLLGLFGLGLAAGWAGRGELDDRDLTTVVVTRPLPAQQQAAPRGTLPNVLGLDADAAKQAYADAGVDAATIQVRRRPHVSEENSVVAQEPTAATRLSEIKGDPVLVLADPATMPDVTGRPADEAIATLGEIGVGATRVVRYEPGVEPGRVASTDPEAGQPATSAATVVVSEAPSSVSLVQLEPVESGCSTGSTDLAGTTVDEALLCPYYSSPVIVTYAVNERVSAFAARVATTGEPETPERARLIVRVDDQVVGRFTISPRPRRVRVPFPGGELLSLEVRGVGEDTPTVAFAGARIVGARSGIDLLTGIGGP